MKVKVGQIIIIIANATLTIINIMLSWNIANSQTNTLVGCTLRNIEYVTHSFDDNRTQVDIK